MVQQPEALAPSTGQVMAGAEWLDVHFEAARPEYEAQLRTAGNQPGCHVLDAACGSGSFLPLMPELADLTGRISALDLAPDNVTLIERVSPFDPLTRMYLRDLVQFFATISVDYDMPDGDREVWQRCADPEGLEHYLDDPDCCLRDLNIPTVGTVPERMAPSH